MKRSIAAALCAILTLAPASAGQMSLLGAGSAGAPASACSPTACPGDISGWSGAYAVYSFRCYTFATTGTIAVVGNIGTPATVSTLTCSGGVVSVTGSALATTCATPCQLTTWNNQSGGAGPNLTGAFGAALPTVTLASFVGQPSPTFVQATGGGNIMSAAAPTALAQPLTIVYALKFATFTGGEVVLANDGFNFIGLGSIFATNRYIQAAGSRDDFTGGSEPVLESIVNVFNGASSTMKINGAAPTTGSANPGTVGITASGKLAIGSVDVGAAFFDGNLYEVIIMSGTKTSGEQAAIVANQRAIGTGW